MSESNVTLAIGTALAKVENYRPDWLERRIAREVEPLRSAIESALAMLGDGPCSQAAEACVGCDYEWREAVAILKGAL